MEESNIELTGFRDIDSSSMAVINKIIGNHAKRIAELTKNMEKFHITLKEVHRREKSEKYEIHVNVLDSGKMFASEAIDRNLFTAIDLALNKMISELD